MTMASDRVLTYDPAFSEEDATIVLTSSDGVNYRLHPFTLRTTSGFFRDMISLPQKKSDSAGDVKDIIQDEHIGLSEGSKVLGTLLSMISGLAVKKWESLDEMEEVLTAAQKYDMPGPLQTLRSAVSLPSPIFLQQPLRLYAIAVRHQWEEEARSASAHTLDLAIHDEEHTSVLEQVPSTYLLKLLRLHRSRRDKFKKYISRDNRCFGIDVCASCSGGRQKTPLQQLAQKLIWEMDRRPAGGVLTDGTWREWSICKGNACPHVGQVFTLIYGERIAEDIKVGLKSLPTMI